MAATTEQYIQAMLQKFRPDKAGRLNVNYILKVTGGGGGTWTIAVKERQCKISGGASSGGDTTIEMNTGNYLKLASGRLDVRSAYQKGEIKVGGNLQNALKFPELFAPWAELAEKGASASKPEPAPPSAPSTPEPPAPRQEPASPAPTAPSAGPTLADYVRAMPNGFRANKAGGANIVYRFDISGTGTWTVTVVNGTAVVAEGAAGTASVAIQMSSDDFKKLAQGKLNTVQAYQRGQIKVSGDINLAAGITDVFAPWADSVGRAPVQPGVKPAPVPEPAPSEPVPTQPETPAPTASTPSGPVNPRLLNGSFDDYQPYIRDGKPTVWKEDQFAERFGKDWEMQIIYERKRRIHVMDSGIFGRFTAKYFGGGGRDYHQHGHHSQVICGRYAFDVVFFQSVAAEPGKTYDFNGMIVSFYKGTSGERKDGKIFKTIGIDPAGGRDYNASTVQWGNRDGKDNEWRYPSLKVKAQGNAVTVFIRIENEESDVGKTELNIIHLENFKLE